MKSSKKDLESRGFVDESAIIIDENIDISLLKDLLSSKIPTERTRGAIIIKKMSLEELVPDLIEALKKEKKLYTKIAIGDALAALKDKSVELLLPLLGAIGNNQHSRLPNKKFGKDSYPCPRDIAARILIRCGETALHAVLNNIGTFSRSQLLEAVDVLGHISFNEEKTEALPALLDLYNKNRDDEVMIWKLIRAFSAFPDERVVAVLKEVIAKKACEQWVWEAERSLRLLGKG
ncbi:MAG: hypothetical protein GY754_22205 [bacterium]|nr:hypothetical protein [bacterium]